MFDYLRLCGDVVTDCAHGFHPVAVDTILFLDWPVFTVGADRESVTGKKHTHTDTLSHCACNVHRPTCLRLISANICIKMRSV